MTAAQVTVLATETATATAGREGRARSADGKVDLQLSPPGSNGPGSNPEQNPREQISWIIAPRNGPVGLSVAPVSFISAPITGETGH